MNPSELAWNQGQTPQSAGVNAPNAALMERVLYEVKRVVVGQDAFLERILVAILAQGHEAVARTARGLYEVVEQGKDEPSADLLTQRIAVHEQTAWMLRSLLEA